LSREEGVNRSVRCAWLVASLVVASCGDHDDPTVYLEVVADCRIETLEVWIKEYLDGGGAVVRQLEPLEVPTNREGYFGGAADDPLRLSIDLPETGRYAVHVLATPVEGEPLPDGPPAREGDVLVETRCLEVGGDVTERDWSLAVLHREDDLDGDTFPEEIAWCIERGLRGAPCDPRCESPEFSAALDCNPASDVPEPGCGPVPADDLHHPFALDLCADCYDQDCDGTDAPCQDRDGDGFPGGQDCNDDDPSIHPGATETCNNGIDENCAVDFSGCDDGDAPCDADGDGYVQRVSATCGVDCNDDDAAIHPMRPEGCGADISDPAACPGCDDFVDNDCDGQTNESCALASTDLDADGVPYLDEATGAVLDCNDCNAAVGMGRTDFCGNGLDEDCSAGDTPCAPGDLDGDGYQSFEAGGTDCDDTDPHSYPGAPERCGDGLAQSCGDDLDCAEITDADGDGFAAGSGDCDDRMRSANPFALETCDPNGTDDDCDGLMNEVEAGEATILGCVFDEDTMSWFQIDFRSDMNHCGACRRSCCPSALLCTGDRCVGGSCSCAGRLPCAGTVGSTCCPDGCQDLSSDERNCGGCGASSSSFVCAAYEQCVPNPDNQGLGECICPSAGTRCPQSGGSACCSAGCVSIWEDPHNCNDCEDDCTATRAGEAGPRGDLCAVNPTDPGGPAARCSCGAPGVQCSGDTWCTNVTEPVRDPPRPTCGCADLRSDPDNCDECGHRCDDDEVCTDRVCLCRGVGGSFEDCRGGSTHACCLGIGCVDLTTDARNCGGCGHRCDVGEACLDGTCRCGTCNDGNPCTTDSCVGGRCEFHTLDADHDGYCGRLPDGTQCRSDEPLTPGTDCEDSPGDCDDSRGGVYPGITERCATMYDDNCDGDTNDLDATGCITHRRDSDRDGFYAAGAPSECRCTAAGIFDSTRSGDCDDSNRDINPAATETCATPFDDDCDGSSNERDAEGCTTYYADNDRDTYGSPASQCWCAAVGTYTATVPGDCNDSNPTIHPGADEMCNSRDDDCDAGTSDGATECPEFCCGGTCQECCIGSQCGSGSCVAYRCSG
jgi:hypothetical protein